MAYSLIGRRWLSSRVGVEISCTGFRDVSRLCNRVFCDRGDSDLPLRLNASGAVPFIKVEG